ncbi:MAG: hypothetical protein P4L84_03290 [Isosphaeraceae bacterium]|nr:hypothetical protein [Isosphaeraceae bacterium]
MQAVSFKFRWQSVGLVPASALIGTVMNVTVATANTAATPHSYDKTSYPIRFSMERSLRVKNLPLPHATRARGPQLDMRLGHSCAVTVQADNPGLIAAITDVEGEIWPTRPTQTPPLTLPALNRVLGSIADHQQGLARSNPAKPVAMTRRFTLARIAYSTNGTASRETIYHASGTDGIDDDMEFALSME